MWAVGIILFEMLFFFKPFSPPSSCLHTDVRDVLRMLRSEEEQQQHSTTTNSIINNNSHYYKERSNEVLDFISSLLTVLKMFCFFIFHTACLTAQNYIQNTQFDPVQRMTAK